MDVAEMDINKNIENFLYKDSVECFVEALEKDNVDIDPSTIKRTLRTHYSIEYDTTICSVFLEGKDTKGVAKRFAYSRTIHVT